MSVDEIQIPNREHTEVSLKPQHEISPHSQNSKPSSPRKKRKRKKISSKITMLIRRIHLYAGLFMLPWVLLYGFTALLFNHPTYLTDSKTEIQHFSLSDEQREQLPTAGGIAEQVVSAANAELSKAGKNQKIEISNPESAGFQRRAFGTLSNEDQSVSLILDLNTGTGYIRKRELTPRNDDEKSKEVSLDNGLNITLAKNPAKQIKESVSDLLVESGVAPDKMQLRGIPTLEFDVMIDGEKKRVRFSPESQRRGRGRPSPQPSGKNKAGIKGKLTIVGNSPREISLRSYLLRLHTAHGYPIQKNSRWFWAIAVDLMFASMVFWGLSGVIMWWQIKRTRKIGFVVLLLSGIVAAWLAIGMHWQLTNG